MLSVQRVALTFHRLCELHATHTYSRICACSTSQIAHVSTRNGSVVGNQSEPCLERSCTGRTPKCMAPKLKVLCLHGYMQNATLFHSRMGSWRKALKASVEFVCLDGPHAAQHSSPESAETERSWCVPAFASIPLRMFPSRIDSRNFAVHKVPTERQAVHEGS